ncbi:TerB family tellurite resistance protein [uncultured Enterovirga sp.]|uniref:tellurite resistance TerB family protein n=1 Tax=uncultured Enterovirga sp. TaxID=2026352 RepID=UPI0035CC0946
MSFVTHLVALLSGQSGIHERLLAGEAEMPRDRLAAAAILVHVARVDGRLDGPERVALVVLLAERFGLRDDVATALVARGDGLDREVDDVAALIEMLGHETDAGDRKRLLAMAYGVAAADGVVQEFEDDLIWRMGHLLGFDDGTIDAVRAEALGDASRA